MESINYKNFKIKTPQGERMIGLNKPVFIVAEISGNHNQNFDTALKIVDSAINAGVDAIKLQTYTPDTLTINSDKDYFRIKTNNIWKGQTLYRLYEKAYTPWSWQPKLKNYAESKGVLLFSTPFDNTAVDFLEKMSVKLYKVSSFEIGDIPLLKKIGKTKKPVIMSRGMASVKEIELAIRTLKECGCPGISLLHCVSSYPARAEEMNLSTIKDISERFNVMAGLSDHTLGINIAIAAVALGASIIEKHVTLSRADGGPDSQFSLEPSELEQLVQSVREVEASIGSPNYKMTDEETNNVIFKKSLFVVKNVKKGRQFTNNNIRSIRPGYGLKPKYLEKILGKTAKTNIERGTPLSLDLIEEVLN